MDLRTLLERLRRLGINTEAITRFHEREQALLARIEELATKLHVAENKVTSLERAVERQDGARLAVLLREHVKGKATEHDAGVRHAAHLLEEWIGRRT